ncbi:unnamed protein product [Merluccius merluccius]
MPYSVGMFVVLPCLMSTMTCEPFLSSCADLKFDWTSAISRREPQGKASEPRPEEEGVRHPPFISDRRPQSARPRILSPCTFSLVSPSKVTP